MKGMGFGLLLSIAMNYAGAIPVVGVIISSYSFYVTILLIVVFLWLGFKG